MPRLPRWTFILGALLLVVLIVLSVAPGIANLYTDYLWFDSVGFGDTWRGLIWARIAPVTVLFITAFVVILVNLVVADRLAPRFRTTGAEDEFLEGYRAVASRFGGRVRILIAVVLAMLLAGAGASVWEDWLLFRHAQSFGVNDPQFGMDIGFYVFRLPFYQFLVKWIFDLFFIVLFTAGIAHYLNGGIRFQPPFRRITPQVKGHLSVLLGVLALVKAVDYWLGRFELNFSSRGFVDGATYTDVKAQLPAYQLLILIALVAAVLFLVNIWRRGWTLPVIAVGLWALVSLVVGTIYPLYVQRFQVKPNELARESRYIERNISATREGFGLDNWETKSFEVQNNLSEADITANAPTLENVRIWDPFPIQEGFNALQALRAFYRFSDTDVDRYTFGDQQRLVFISTRELDEDKIPSKSWTSIHLQYTNGYGAVVSLGNAKVPGDASPVFSLQDIPPTGQPSFDKQPSVYFGEGLSGYVLVDTKQQEYQPVGENDNAGSHFSGDGGVKISNIWRKAALAIRFGDLNPFISGQTTKDSQAFFVRDVRERAQKAAPFLSFDTDPYPVILDGRMLWVIDGYTTSSRYPYSQRFPGSTQKNGSDLTSSLNYVRNSVKVTVDAYDGSMNFYVVDKGDPILRAYREAFPKMFDDLDEAPEGLTQHFRYPEDLFRLQTEVYGEYRLSDAADFFRLDNAWAVASSAEQADQSTDTTETTEATNAQGRAARLKAEGDLAEPLYLQLEVPGQENPEFVLMQTFSPLRREALMSGFVIARQDGENYGKVQVYEVKAGEDNLPASPAQIASQSQSIQEISETESLLSRGRSDVSFGSVQVLPVNNSFVYVQSFYVKGAAASAFPRVRFVIVSYGDRSVLAGSVAEGLQTIFAGGGGVPDEVAGDGESQTTTSTTAASGDRSVQQLLDDATAAFDAADEALRKGNLAGYQENVKRGQDLVRQAAEQASS